MGEERGIGGIATGEGARHWRNRNGGGSAAVEESLIGWAITAPTRPRFVKTGSRGARTEAQESCTTPNMTTLERTYNLLLYSYPLTVYLKATQHGLFLKAFRVNLYVQYKVLQVPKGATRRAVFSRVYLYRQMFSLWPYA